MKSLMNKFGRSLAALLAFAMVVTGVPNVGPLKAVEAKAAATSTIPTTGAELTNTHIASSSIPAYFEAKANNKSSGAYFQIDSSGYINFTTTVAMVLTVEGYSSYGGSITLDGDKKETSSGIDISAGEHSITKGSASNVNIVKITLTPKVVLNTELTFNKQLGDSTAVLIKTESQAQTGKVKFPTLSDETGYEFDAWYKGTTKVTDVANENVPTTATTYTAKYNKLYSVTCAAASNGTIAADDTEVTEGTKVTITGTPDAGYALKEITVTDIADPIAAVDNKAEFTMPAKDVTVSAEFVSEASLPKWTVTAGENVTISVSENKIDETTLTDILPGETVYATSSFTDDQKYVKAINYSVNDAEAVAATKVEGKEYYSIEVPAIDSAVVDNKIEVSAVIANKTHVTTTNTDGTVSIDKEYAIPGEKVTATVTAPEGKKVASVSCNEVAIKVNKSGVYGITASGESMSIAVTFEDIDKDAIVPAIFRGMEANEIYGESEPLQFKSRVGFYVAEPGVEEGYIQSGPKAPATAAKDGLIIYAKSNAELLFKTNISSSDPTKIVYFIDLGAKTDISDDSSVPATGTDLSKDYSAYGSSFATKVDVEKTYSVKAGRMYFLTLGKGGNIRIDDLSYKVEKSYTVTVSDSIANGTVTADKTEAKEGETVTLTATPASGYVLDAYTVKNGEEPVTVTDNKFTMPAGNVTVSATFRLADTTNYSVSVNAIENGTVTADKTEAKEGDTVTLTVTPAEGYVLDKITVMNGTTPVTVTDNKFTMPAANVTVSATFKVKEEEKKTYTYVAADAAAKPEGGADVTLQADVKKDIITALTEIKVQYVNSSDSSEIKATIDDVEYVGRMQTQKISTSTNPVSGKRGFKIEMPTAGKIKVGFVTGSSSDDTRSLGIYDASGTEIYTEVAPKTAGSTEYAVTSAGTYYVSASLANGGGSINFFYIKVETEEELNPTTYDVTVNTAVNGTVTVDKTTAAEGDVVTVTTTPATGYTLDTLTVMNGTSPVTVTGGKFTMPAGNVTVTATFKVKGTPTKKTYTYVAADAAAKPEGGADVVLSADVKKDIITALTDIKVQYVNSSDSSEIKATIDDVEYVGRMQTQKISTSTNPVSGKRGFKIEMPTAGKIKVGFVTGSSSDDTRSLGIYDASGTEIYTEVAPKTAGSTEYAITSAGTYYVSASLANGGGSINFFYITVETEEESDPTTYDVTVAPATNGTVSVDKTKAAEGDVVTVTTTPATGYTLDTLTVMNGTSPVTVTDGKFTMPAGNVTVTATFKAQGATEYTVTVAPATNGTVTANKSKAVAGDEVSLTVTPAAGYVLDKLTVMNGTTPVEVKNNKFTMPAGNVTVTATFKAQGAPTPAPIPEGIDTEEETSKDGDYVFTYEAEKDFTGAAIKPFVAVEYNGVTLVPGVDYSVAYKNNKNVYTAKQDDKDFDAKKAPQITITGKGNYVGKDAVLYFTINEVKVEKEGDIVAKPFIAYNSKDASGDDVDPVATKKGIAFTGDAIDPIAAGLISLKTKAKVANVATELSLEPGVDYVYSIANNINVGTANIYVKCMGKYKGEAKLTFKIAKADLSQLVDAENRVIGKFTFKAKGNKPVVEIGDLLVGSDYKLAYKNNVKVNTPVKDIDEVIKKYLAGDKDAKKALSTMPTVTATGTGNYTGKLEFFFDIDKADINSDLDVYMTAVKSGAAISSAVPSVFDADGNMLKAKTDFVVDYYVSVDGGEAKLIGAQGVNTGIKDAKGKDIVVKVGTKLNTLDPEVFTVTAVVKANTPKTGNATVDGEYSSIELVNATEKATLKSALTDKKFAAIYTGEAIELEAKDFTTTITVGKDKPVTLTLGTDYKVVYSNNVNKGTATAYIIPSTDGVTSGEKTIIASGVVKVTFKINPNTIAKPEYK